jgi:hypothetical protein
MTNNIYPHDHADHNGHDNLLIEFERRITMMVTQGARLPQNDFGYQCRTGLPLPYKRHHN